MESAEILQKKVVLVIEDDPIMLNLYENAFKSKGVQVFVAHDGEEGLKLIQETLPNCVILDILMPKMNGVEVLKIMRGDDRTKNIPVLVLTNYENYRDKVEPMGISDYLIKANVTLNDVMERTFKVWGGKIEEKS